ncbi:MAG: hypothetical protein ACK4IK_11795 [Bacteroidia bacterium]
MKNLIKALFIAVALIISYTNAKATNEIKSSNYTTEECVSHIEIMNYVNRNGYYFVDIIEEIDCDRIVRTETVYLYVMVRGGKIVGSEEIPN